MEKIKHLFEKYESIISPATLIGGFIFDFLTLQRVDFFTDNIFIIMYLVFSGASIIIMDLYDDGKLQNKFTENLYEFLPFILQFCFGGLFSAFVIFYSKSAALFTSGAFVFIMIFFLVGNEFFKKHYSKLIFQTGIYFLAIFSFSIYFIPVLFKEMGAVIFIISGLVSLFVIGVFIFIVYWLTPEKYLESHKIVVVVVLGTYAVLNILYFKNIIPPIPLSLKEGDVYHLIEKKANGTYEVTGERDKLREKFGLSQNLHLRAGDPAYVFSSIFAPTDLDTTITHNWQHFDAAKGEWVSASKISFPITGGRSDGYRGFSMKRNLEAGKWRVDITTSRGQVIGRVRFDILIVDFPPEFQTEHF